MIEHLATIASGLLRYLILCVISIASGVGFMRLIRLTLPLRLALVFAPVLTLALWSVVLGIGVVLRVPVRFLAAPLWGVTLVCALYGLRTVFGPNRTSSEQKINQQLGFVATAPGRDMTLSRRMLSDTLADGWLIVLCLALPVAVMVAYFRAGLANYPGSELPDGWSYIAYGQYLWQYPRGAEGGLAPLYQFAAHLSNTRFMASSLLGFLSPIGRLGDTQSVSNLFLAWGLFTFATSCAFFGCTFGLRAVQLSAYLILTIVAGWLYNVLWANNYDNLLALAFFPAIVGAITWIIPQQWSWRIVLGLLGAGLLYCYPELAIVIFGGAALVLAERIWAERTLVKSWLVAIAGALSIMIALVAPFISTMYRFVAAQAAVGLQTGVRPGEGFFPGLLTIGYLPSAFWGLGGEYAIEAWALVRNGIGGFLSALAILGVIYLIRHRLIGFTAIAVMLLAACGILIGVQAYSYGAYKMILLGWWMFSFTLVLGLGSIADWIPMRAQRAVAIGMYALIIGLTLAFNPSVTNSLARQTDKISIAQFRTLEQLKQLPNAANILVAVDDTLANEWAVYFLRDIPIRLEEYRMYMAQAHVVPYMERAQDVPPESTHYVLTDAAFDGASDAAQPWELVWSGGPYRLWDPAGTTWAKIIGITNANGLEMLDGEHFFWMGQGDTTINVLAGKAGTLRITAMFLPGPSVLNQTQRTFSITSSAGYSHTFTVVNGAKNMLVPLQSGLNTFVLRPLDQVTAPNTTTGDIRPLVLGVKSLKVQFENASAIIERIDNANGLEQLDGVPFFWIGQGSTKIVINSLQAGQLALMADFMLGPSVLNADRRQLMIESDSGYTKSVSITAGQQQIELPIGVGETTITLTPLDQPTQVTRSNGDKRPLILGVKGLTVLLGL